MDAVVHVLPGVAGVNVNCTIELENEFGTQKAIPDCVYQKYFD